MRTTMSFMLMLIVSPAIAQHDGDVLLREHGGVIQPGQIIDGLPSFPIRVFAAEFGHDGIPNFTDEPGFDSEAGAFDVDLGLGFDLHGPLLTWDGDAFVGVAPMTVTISRGASSVQTPTDDVDVPGFVFGSANGSGIFHHHLGFSLDAPAMDGITLLTLSIWSDTNAPGESGPIWIVFNQNASEDEHDEAIDWVRTHLAGCLADWNSDGSLDIFDVLSYLDAFDGGDVGADLNEDGHHDIFDILAFLDAFDAGC
ncbi:MAG: hypothetical protein KDA28_01895 [Phycisphaerales bacterium]|nr:hypothetical protein [Phycisphaerales bacterium]